MELNFTELALILHVIGGVCGAGGATAAGMIFKTSIADFRVSSDEFRFIKGISQIIWIGFILLFLSGLYLAWTGWEYISISEKFWAKQTVVLIILVNGLFLNLRITPRIGKLLDIDLRSSSEFMRWLPGFYIAGAVSGVSWYSALILGAWRSLPFSYIEIMSVYFFLVGVAAVSAVAIGKKTFRQIS